jgi:hypothetical protein
MPIDASSFFSSLTATFVAAALLNSPVHAQGAEAAAGSDALEAGFAEPPASARPRVWWHWMNGNITKDGIRKDLEWMKRVGIGGMQNFDANLNTPTVVDQRLVYMTPEWKDAFRYAASLANDLDLELAIASSPGWSETGGPWVQSKDGLKKVVWSETVVAGGKQFAGKLAAPPTVIGPFQALPNSNPMAALSGNKVKDMPPYYADIAVLAYPVAGAAELARPHASLGSGEPVDAAALQDGDLQSAINVPRGEADGIAILKLAYDAAQTVRSATIFVPGRTMFSGASVLPRLEVSADGNTWRKLADLPLNMVPTTVSFAPVTAREFRVVFAPTPAAPMMREIAPGVAGGEMFAALRGSTQSIKVGELQLSPQPKVDRFESKAGFAIEPDYYAIGTAQDEAGIATAKVIDLTGRMQADGTLDWKPPRGTWRVVRLGYSLLGTTNHPATAEATGLEVDKFDGSAVRSYMETYLGMYRETVGAELLGNHGVRALLTDSIEVGAANWTPRMIEQFKRLRGYDPTSWLPALTGVVIESRSASDAFLYDYRRTLSDLMASEHYGTVATVAHENGLKVYGEALEDNRPSLGDDIAMRSHADVPMAAMWTFSRETGPSPTYLADIKGAASVAHIYGQNLVAAESLTSMLSPWAHAPSDLRRIIDLEFVTGVNRPVIHTSVHQPLDDKVPGLSLFIFGQYFNRHETWAEMARPWVDYISRNSFMLQQGRHFADVAYFYGEEAPLTGLYGQKPIADAPARYDYDFINTDALMNQLTAAGDELVAKSGARYKALYLGGSSQHITLSTLQQIASLATAGATIVGVAPESSPSLKDDKATFDALVRRLWSGESTTKVGQGRVIAGKDVEAALAATGVGPDFSYTKPQADTEIPFLHRRIEAGDVYFLSNRRNRPEHVEARFRVVGKAPQVWRADSGVAEPVSYRIEGSETVVPLDMDAEESFFVVFRTPTTATAATVDKPAPSPAATLDGSWDVTLQPKLGGSTSIKLAALGSLSEQANPAVKYFSGVSTYTKDFELPKGVRPGTPLLLDLGKVGDLAEVVVNGKPIDTAWHAPYRLDIGSATKRGGNRIEIRVANLWVNRLVGDAQPGATQTTFTAGSTYRADAPLRPSGLIGPVQLLRP